MKDGLFVDEFGTKAWYNEGEIHREDGPAVVYINGDKFWCKEGDLHRKNGPAVILADGSQAWYKNGLFHREGGPAVVLCSGAKEWWINGECIEVRLPDGNPYGCHKNPELDSKPTKYLTGQIVI